VSRYSLLFLLSWLLTSAGIKPALGQPYLDLLSARHLAGPGELGSPGGDKLRSEYSFLQLQLPLPLKKSPQRTLILAPYSDEWTVRSEDSAVALRGYGLPVNFLIALDSSRWDLLGSVIFRWNAYQASLRDPSQYGAALLIGRKYSEKLRLRYGIYVNREYFGWWVLPLLGVDWIWKDGSRVFGILPGSLTWERKLSRKWYHGLSYRAVTTSYRIPDQRYLRINETQLGAFLDYYPLRWLAINLEGGHSIFRNFRAGRVDTRGAELPARDSWYVRFGLSLRKRFD
jgi:hypothetical protein